jgi:hypothetical protein
VALSNARCQGKPFIGPEGITCSCGVVFDRGEVEDRAAAYLWHRRGGRSGGKVGATEAFIWADGMKGATTVPDDKPPLRTVTVFLMPTGRTSAALDKVENVEWRDGVLHVHQTDGTESHYPKHIVHHVTTEEGSGLAQWQAQMNQHLDDLGPLEPGI